MEHKTKLLIKLLKKNGNYILKVKSNQKDLLDDIKTYFDIELKNENLEINFINTDFENNHEKLNKGNIIFLTILLLLTTKNKWKIYLQLEWWDVTVKKIQKSQLKTIIILLVKKNKYWNF